ncbi:DUF305 domain-containing protein [Phytohabitans sp. ZYX-F-186]|uniref:DUF305 domain-containing protein n=1 Tax=Phytohabitans maris TaxID=3071409 RepID=A0ABU0ZJU0_9ACTN|nr:DUF305 domain-containing protein [Phytohabitans sp. ZYX-F-186]MDQ7906217.1 DUF305 domain-containing protein [Phytohabitans sp. ZYX-F-186]
MSRRVAVALMAVLLAGCTASPAAPSTVDTPGAASGGLGNTDVMFLQMILPHHRQGVELAGLGRAKGGRAELVQLAAAIEATQRDEVELMAGILADSGAPASAPAPPGGPDPHAAHGGLPGTGEQQVAALRASTGTEFERRFLNTMMAHQGDAIALAKMELASGADPRLVDLAGRIERSRTAQIEQMQRLLDATPR